MTFWPLLHWLAIHVGSENEPGVWYGFWSGFGSDIGEVTIIGGMIMMYRKHNCHQPGCWRIGRHRIEGTEYMVCRKHHPDDHAKVRDELNKLRAAA
jgi:hypothetical protein